MGMGVGGVGVGGIDVGGVDVGGVDVGGVGRWWWWKGMGWSRSKSRDLTPQTEQNHKSLLQLSLTHTICKLFKIPVDWDWTQESGWQSSGSPVDWTGLDSSGLGILPANLACFEKSQSPPDAVSRAPPITITNPASTIVAGLMGPAVLEDIKEGMQQFLVSGLSITDPNLTPSYSSPLSASPLSLSGQRSSPLLVERSSPLSGGPTTPRWWIHMREKESLSSLSTHAMATSVMMRYSQCSSSTAASSLGSKELGGDDAGEGEELLGERDDFCVALELMVHDTGATLTMSPNPAFKCKGRQQCAVEPQQPVPGEPQPQGEPDNEEEFNKKDVIPLHWSSGLSAIEPGLKASATTASSVGSSRVPSLLPELEGTAKLEGGSSGREKTNGNMQASINMNGHRYVAQSDGRVGGGVNGMGSLPPPLSIPGSTLHSHCLSNGL
ncbi:uncharacterized protein LACBIDRAFT_323107 [Laccaria bicolor S238N-H82]|uniref:Predicted protein n=1 Tax=Laccaria bicolor (strain S238N-H82 / ATCC MYA-4686) TaxID=486041 RepID=B0CZ55_LACBS|nr:uncharacterized protein LACBIDRAFT_323107 [Laccaria bicolor S238N-H82]EDR12089.1 predicted protein [Laccaria bicolor S238N-H82]|eukprot:XP_001876353.1 predicted protein [Laccaria bicolor S238N-H82]